MTQGEPTAMVIAILAAGASSRMRGGDKLLEMVQGEPLLRRQARLALQTGATVLVALPIDRPDRSSALAGLAVRVVAVREAHLGMSVSLRAALAVARAMDLPPKTGFMVLPADMPDFTAEALDQIIQTYFRVPDRIVRATSATRQPGHPAIFPREFWDDLDTMSGDQGGRAVLAAHAEKVLLVALPCNMATTDLDTPEDWAAWRAGQAE